jgi:polysaccharide pyruvyl transferase WcaK-like protein
MIKAFQICNGLGAGNVGDEIMARAFWNLLPADVALTIALLPESERHRQPYPAQHLYVPVDWNGNENAEANMPGLLVGATPVTEGEGLHWPMEFLAPRLLHFHGFSLPVDAIGVGVDHLSSAAAKSIFYEAFRPIRSWTVRSGFCRDALISLGVSESAVRVGADLAWAYTADRHLDDWADGVWRSAGIDPSRPLLVANFVNMQWRERTQTRAAIAAAIEEASIRFGLQIAFFCNECRSGDFFDFAAASEFAALMRPPVAFVPNEYYAPAEAIALLRRATVTVGQRYHFIVETVLAGSVPVAIVRGQKMLGLSAELPTPVGGSVEETDRDTLFEAIENALDHRDELIVQLESVRCELARRAATDLSFLAELTPYRGSNLVTRL